MQHGFVKIHVIEKVFCVLGTENFSNHVGSLWPKGSFKTLGTLSAQSGTWHFNKGSKNLPVPNPQARGPEGAFYVIPLLEANPAWLNLPGTQGSCRTLHEA